MSAFCRVSAGGRLYKIKAVRKGRLCITAQD